jgi:deoxyribodipyrimidine photolyase-related protein
MGRGRISIWILGDQLLASHPALIAAGREEPGADLCLVFVESQARTHKLAYQRKKLVLLFSAMRHYAAALQSQGYRVDYVMAPTFGEGLQEHLATFRPTRLVTMAASEYDTRHFQEGELARFLGIPVCVLPNTQFLVGQFDPYPGAEAGQRLVMEYFYRSMRRHWGVLLEAEGGPAGGRWNYDRQNRQPLPRDLQVPDRIRFTPDSLTQQVMAEVEAAGHSTGTAIGFDLAVTRQEALLALEDFLDRRLARFGPYEDAMSSQHPTLFHSALSPYLNIGLLEPMELIRAAEQAYRDGRVPLPSAEGFVRQILGWREYIYWQYWRFMPGLLTANVWHAQCPMPSFFWSGQTEMQCLHAVLGRAIDTGYNHHIERLMILCNFCLLAGIQPAAVHDWFLSTYVDAYEWVMAPNVLGMGLHADGGLIATKPYIASAHYINRMSDYCPGCRFDPRQRTGPVACPFNLLYWSFLLAHEPRLRANPRLGPNVLGLRHLDEVERQAVRRQAQAFLQQLEDPLADGKG